MDKYDGQPVDTIHKFIKEIATKATDDEITFCYWLTYEDSDTDTIRAAFAHEYDRRGIRGKEAW